MGMRQTISSNNRFRPYSCRIPPPLRRLRRQLPQGGAWPHKYVGTYGANWRNVQGLKASKVDQEALPRGELRDSGERGAMVMCQTISSSYILIHIFGFLPPQSAAQPAPPGGSLVAIVKNYIWGYLTKRTRTKSLYRWSGGSPRGELREAVRGEWREWDRR